MAKNNGKKSITILLLLSCIISGIILAGSPAYKSQHIHSFSTLDSLIEAEIHESGIWPSHVRSYTVEIDTSFTRKVYRVRVPSRFSKTLLHLQLNDALIPYDIKTPARVTFPDRDMNIYVYEGNTVFRTIRLQTDSGIDSLYYSYTEE